MTETTRQSSGPKDSAWAPLRIRAFRALWLAQLGSMIGTWMQTVGAQWLLVDEPGAETLVAMVQVAAMLPALVLALPAGALADILDRRRMLIGVQAFQAAVALALTALTLAGQMSPALLLTFTLLLGCGITLTLPAYQAFVQELVPRAQIRSAAALGGVAVNGARAVGPAVAGLIIAQVGPAAVFALNAVGYLVLIVVLLTLRRPVSAAEPTMPERFTSAIRAGQRYVRHSMVVRRMLLRIALFVLPGAALWALLPLVADRLLGTGSTGYGVLLAALGAGAVVGADLLPRVSRRQSANRLLLVAGLTFTAALVACVLVRNLVALAVLLVPAGIAWLWALMTVTGALQMFLPAWVRARGLSMFNIVFAGGQAIGAFIWGVLAQWWGLVPAFLTAAAVMAIGTATVVVWPLHNVAGVSRELATLPDPELASEPDPDEGPVLVTLTYTVDDERVPEFLDVVAQLRRSRLRTGARSSELYRDGADLSRFVLVSEYDTWGEHLREHTGRLTVADHQLYEAARALAVEPPEVRHMFGSWDKS